MRSWRSCAAALLWTISLVAANPLTLGDLAGMDSIRLEPAHAVDGITFKVGHAQFRLDDGRIARIMLGEHCLGFCFQGNGKLSYVSQARWEAAALQYNAGHNTALKVAGIPGEDISWDSGFTRAVFWSSTVPGWFQGKPAETLDKPFKSMREKFAAAPYTLPLSGLVAQSENTPNRPWLRVEMDGGSDPLLYEFDPSSLRVESLDALEQPRASGSTGPKWLRTVQLSSQPIGWDIRDPEAGEFLLSSVDVDLRETKSARGEMTVTETLIPNGAPLRLIRLNLNHHDLSYSGWGSGFPEEKVTSVKDGQGHDLPFRQDEFEILVELPVLAPAGAPVQLTFRIEGDFLPKKDHSDYWQLGTDAWFPQPDLNGQMYTWHATVRVKKPRQAFSCGDTVRRWEEGDYACVETRSDKPIAFAVIQAGNYRIRSETRNGLTVEVASYDGVSKSGKTLADIAFYAIDRYQRFLGAYPYKEFHILEMNDWGYGQAPASIMFITHEAFNQVFDETNRVFSHDVRGRFIHEIAHQWWGGTVKMPSREEQWLTESFADMSAAILLQSWPNGRAEGEYKELLTRWKTDAQMAAPRASIPTANRVASPDGYTAYQTRTGLLYAKGPWLLYCIQKEIGEKEFLTFLKSYQTNFRWKFGTTKDVAGLLSFLTKKDWNPWFEENYWGTGMPVLKE
ncbi:MAG TPA: M1 family aminopeptidase [Holophagaceae bacterium]|nr:M1 family aminopeptidase [Holophagaceae bacterium]